MNTSKTVFGGMMGLLAGLSLGLFAVPASAQFGPILSGTGPINRSMGGAATAAPLSASGALLWNPASLAGLDRSELDVGAELLVPHARVSSSVGPFTGTTENQDAVFALPTIALAYRPEQSPFTYGLGVFAVAGFGLDYPGSALAPGANPILLPQPFGLGPIFSQYQVLQVAPALVYSVNDQLSVSFSPLLDIGMAQLDPAVYADPVLGVYPPGTHSRTAWGGGFSLGAYYEADAWAFGASYKSKQWFQSYQVNTIDALNMPSVAHLSLDLPSIVSVGTSYKGLDRWLLAADLRYLDFSNTGAFGDSGFSPTGALQGVGFQSIFVVALGAQYQLTDALVVRAGYSWSENPIPNSQTTASVASPLVIQNILSVGTSYQLTDAFVVSMAYMHSFENSISGPIVLPGGAIPGSSITNTASADSLLIGATVKFGCPKSRVPCATTNTY